MEYHVVSNDGIERLPLMNKIKNGEARTLDLRGASLAGQDLMNADLSGIDMTGADLSGANLFKASLRNAILHGAKLNNCELTGADLTSANLEEADVRGAGLGMAVLCNAKLFNANLEETTLSKSDLSGADLRCAKLGNARLRETNLTDADLTEADLRNVDLSLSNVSDAIFTNADMRGARLRMVNNYEKAKWIGVDMRDINFAGAYMMRRFIMDENYIKEFKEGGKVQKAVYYLWWITSDCGRSLARWMICIAAQIIVFSFIYPFVSIDYGDYPTFLSPLYFSVVTLTTLGYGDIVPSSLAGQIVSMTEVCTGYIMLGGLLSIFSNKLSRRAE